MLEQLQSQHILLKNVLPHKFRKDQIVDYKNVFFYTCYASIVLCWFSDYCLIYFSIVVKLICCKGCAVVSPSLTLSASKIHGKRILLTSKYESARFVSFRLNQKVSELRLPAILFCNTC